MTEVGAAGREVGERLRRNGRPACWPGYKRHWPDDSGLRCMRCKNMVNRKEQHGTTAVQRSGG